MKIAELIGKLDYHFNTLAGEVIMDQMIPVRSQRTACFSAS